MRSHHVLCLQQVWVSVPLMTGDQFHLPLSFSPDPSITPRRGRDLWSKLRQTVKQTSLADVLNALGAIPSGFRDSTMANLLTNSCKYTDALEKLLP